MLPLRPLSLSALLLAASACVSAAEPGAEALAAPQAPALQVTPAVETAPALPTVPAVAPAETPAEARSAPLVPGLPGLPAGAAALGALLDPQTLALLDQLGALQVTPQQALGGVGALLGLAQSQLAADQYAQLAGSVPGLELLGGPAGQAAEASDGAGGVLGRLGALGALGGLLGASPAPAAPPQAPLDSRAGVDQAFALLGMDSSLVGPFGQILLQFLAGQGLAGTLLQSLGGIWGVPATPMVGTPVASGH